MTKPGYRMTEIGEIPEEWKIDKVSNLQDSMYYGITAKSTEQRSDLRFLRTTDISNFNFDPNDLHYCEITGTKPDLSKYHLKQGDIIVARAGTVGISVLVKRDLLNTIFGSYLIKIAFNKDLIYANFVHYYFQSNIYWNKLRAAQGSTIKNISLPFLKALFLPVPPLQEQKKIAAILSTADETIQKVDEEITLTEKLKKGLMQTLLTKGIGHTKFKMTEIGEIPEEWGIKTLSNSCSRITDGSHYSPQEVKGGTRMIATVFNLGNNSVITDTCKRISDKDYELLVKNGCKPDKGDVLFSKDGTVGICFPYFQEDNLVLLSSIAILKPDNDLNSAFLSCFLKSENGMRQIIGLKTGSALKRITLKNLKLVKIPIPSYEEQQKVATILTTVDHKLELLRNKRTHLEELKKGMMEDLLTGRVRVKI